MILPHTKQEQKILSNKKTVIIGVDEAGRGPLAGPVVAGAVWVNPKILQEDFKERELIRDSKTLSEKQREKAFVFMQQNENFVLGIGEVGVEIIDEINILQASLLAMRLAVEEVISKLKDSENKKLCLLIDGNQKIPKIEYQQKLFLKGDKNIFSIAVASIYAKVYRDQIMKNYHKKFSKYGFDRHKGYGTKYHLEQLAKNGPCSIHRKSFSPVKKLLSKEI